MTWSFSGTKNSAHGAALASLNVTLNGTLAGSFVAVSTSAWCASGGPTSLAVSDGTNGSYSQAVLSVSGFDNIAGIHYIASGAGGNLTITSNPSGGTDSNGMFVAAAEFLGGNASPLSGTPATNGGAASTSLSTGSMTPADNDCLLLAVATSDTSGTITENAGSEGYTLIAEQDNAPVGDECGSFVYKILSGGSGSAQSESWTVSVTEAWAAAIAAFKPSRLQMLMLLGVGS